MATPAFQWRIPERFNIGVDVVDRYADAGASPLRAPDLAGGAPSLVIVCELDPLRDEGVEYARRLDAAGVPITLIEEPGMIHGYARLFAAIDRAQKTVADVSDALREAFAKGVAEATR